MVPTKHPYLIPKTWKRNIENAVKKEPEKGRLSLLSTWALVVIARPL
jgi:hypothetical protein